MKMLSLWALMNPVKSWIIIAFCQILLTIIAIYSGIWLFAQDIFVPQPIFYTGIIFFLLGFTFYPIRRARYKFWKYNYVRHKTMDMLMLVGFMLSAVSMSNWDANAAWNNSRNQAQAIPVVLKAFEKTKQGISQSKSLNIKEIRKNLQRRYKEFVVDTKHHAGSPEDNKGTIALVIVLMILLMLGIAALACTIACSGADGLGVFILIGGWILILVGGISIIRKLKGKRKNQ